MTRSLMLSLSFIVLFSGCATKPPLVGGAEDLIRLPKGTVIEGVQLVGNKLNVTTQKDGLWISLDGWNRVEQTKGNGQ